MEVYILHHILNPYFSIFRFPASLCLAEKPDLDISHS